MSDTKARDLATKYVSILTDWLTPHQMRMVRKLNASDDYSDGTCASHDFCDASAAMLEAFISVMGYDPISNESGMADADLDLWEEAWGIARNGALVGSE